jgi:hypothetical protein
MSKPFGLRSASEPRPPQPFIDTSTTAGAIKATSSQRWRNKITQHLSLSLPVPVQKDGKAALSFFLYLCPGSFSNKKILPPSYRAEVGMGEAEDTIEFVPIEPQALNINVSSMTEIGAVYRDSSYLQDEVEVKKRNQEHQQRKIRFYESIDKLLENYLKASEVPSEETILNAKIYKDYFYSQDEVKFLLPAYQALNPHFFYWIDSVD